MCTARLFSQGVNLFALKFDMDRVVPINHSWRQITSDTGLPDGKDRILMRSFVLTQYRSVTDGQTDGRMDQRGIYSALRSAVKIGRISAAEMCRVGVNSHSEFDRLLLQIVAFVALTRDVNCDF